MKEFILYNTLSLLGIIPVVILLMLLTMDSLEAVTWSIWAGIILFVVVCMVSGALSVIKLNNLYLPVIVNSSFTLVFVFFWLIFQREYGMGMYLAALFVGALTFVSALMTLAIRSVSAIPQISLKIPLMIFLVLAVVLALYLGMAYLSQFAYMPFRESKFFYTHTADEEPEWRLMELPDSASPDWMRSIWYDRQTGEPYSGIYQIYAPKLHISPKKPLVSGLSYFIEGRLTGYSSSGKSGVQNLISDRSALAGPDFMPDKQRLIHKAYSSVIEAEIASWGDYYVVPADKIPLWRPHSETVDAIVSYIQEEVQYKKEFYLHPNGVICRIETFTWREEDVWTDWQHEYGTLITFDPLGYSSEKTKEKWDINDFVYIDRYPNLFIDVLKMQ